MWITNRHTVAAVTRIAVSARAIVRAFRVGADCVLVALVLAGSAFVDFDTVPLVGSCIAVQAVALEGSEDVDASGIHITMMSFLATPL